MNLPDKTTIPNPIIKKIPLYKMRSLANEKHITFQIEKNALGKRTFFYYSQPYLHSLQKNIFATWTSGEGVADETFFDS